MKLRIEFITSDHLYITYIKVGNIRVEPNKKTSHWVTIDVPSLTYSELKRFSDGTQNILKSALNEIALKHICDNSLTKQIPEEYLLNHSFFVFAYQCKVYYGKEYFGTLHEVNANCDKLKEKYIPILIQNYYSSSYTGIGQSQFSIPPQPETFVTFYESTNLEKDTEDDEDDDIINLLRR